MARTNAAVAAERSASAAVNEVVFANAADVLDKIHQLPATPWSAKLLSKFADQTPDGASGTRQLHARLALLTVFGDVDAQVSILLESLLVERPEYVTVIRRALHPHKDVVAEDLWAVLQRDGGTDSRRFRAGLALAEYFPNSHRWREQDFHFLAEHMIVPERPDDQRTWRDCIRPLASTPIAHDEFLDRWQRLLFSDLTAVRLNSAYALADFARDDQRRLASLLSTAGSYEFKILYPLINDSPLPALIAALEEMASEPPTEAPSAAERIEVGKKRAGAAFALLRLGDFSGVLPIFATTDDPEAMTQFIHGCRDRGIRAEDLLSCLAFAERQNLCSDRVRYAILSALSDYDLTDVPASDRDQLVDSLERQYEGHPSSAVHSITGWLLGAWGRQDLVDRIDRTTSPYAADREWFTLRVPSGQPGRDFYMTFIVFQPGIYEIGSWDDFQRDGKELRHKITISRRFALLDREISFEELAACNRKHQQSMAMYTGNPATAGPGTMWYDSVKFCRWLTTQAGISGDSHAYDSADVLDVQQYPRDVVATWAPKDWPVPRRNEEYRLPTEAEWECACRSSVRTAFSFGGDKELLKHYAWFAENSGKVVHPSKQLRPSQRGLFDIHGNLFEWCQDWMGPYATEDLHVDPIGAKTGPGRVLRGGCWGVLPAFCRSSNRINMPPSTNFIFEGIRPCITLPLDKKSASELMR
ncbi:MAG: formylglycine-generating enzyme family protein [Planctomycetales bacterium]|nr:formylglycine-generating enzyme family protein [Planctomycetales bacterium]